MQEGGRERVSRFWLKFYIKCQVTKLQTLACTQAFGERL